MDIREQTQVDQVKASLKLKLIDFSTVYLMQFKAGWPHTSDQVFGEAIRQLEAEKFLAVRTGRKGAVILMIREIVR
jgi:hypothetical protein